MGRATEDAVFAYLSTHEPAEPGTIASALSLSTSQVKRALPRLKGRGIRPMEDGHSPVGDKRWGKR